VSSPLGGAAAGRRRRHVNVRRRSSLAERRGLWCKIAIERQNCRLWAVFGRRARECCVALRVWRFFVVVFLDRLPLIRTFVSSVSATLQMPDQFRARYDELWNIVSTPLGTTIEGTSSKFAASFSFPRHPCLPGCLRRLVPSPPPTQQPPVKVTSIKFRFHTPTPKRLPRSPTDTTYVHPFLRHPHFLFSPLLSSPLLSSPPPPPSPNHNQLMPKWNT